MHKQCILGLFLALTFPGLASAQITARAWTHHLEAACGQAPGHIHLVANQVQAPGQPQPAGQAQPANQVSLGAQGQPSGQPQPPDPCPAGTNDIGICFSNASLPSDIFGATEKALACEWLSCRAAPHMLAAMGDYIQHHRPEAVHEVEAPVPQIVRQLYEEAQLLPSGEPSGLGTARFLVMLASANTRSVTKMSDVSKTALITQAKNVLSSIFQDDNGRRALIKSNYLFSQGGCCDYRAMYELLFAVPEPEKVENADQYSKNISQYLDNLESLRAAYALGDGKLALAVSEKIQAPE